MSTKTKFWTEDLIRKEMKKLDAIAHREKWWVLKKYNIVLDSSTIPIRFNNQKDEIGMFKNEDTPCFYFSRCFFDDDTFPESVCLEVIRNVYAHYFTYMCFHGNLSHNYYWQEVCKVIGANPNRVRTEDFIDRRLKVEKNDTDQYSPVLKCGDIIHHKKYGEGFIKSTSIYRNGAIHSIKFKGRQILRLDERWILQNCKPKENNYE